jgi:aminoglycoside N3'-acetyltransferase
MTDILTKDDFLQGFREVGIEAGMHVVAHSSMKRFGRYIEDGADTIIDVLEEIITPDGTLVMPTFTSNLIFFIEAFHARNAVNNVSSFMGTFADFYHEMKNVWESHNFQLTPFNDAQALWGRIRAEGLDSQPGLTIEMNREAFAAADPFRMRREAPVIPPDKLYPNQMPVTTGIITDAFWQRPETRRSMQYSGSFTAWGKMTDYVLERHDNHSQQETDDHPLYRLERIGGKILLMGINHGNNSSIHTAQKVAYHTRGLFPSDTEFVGHFQNLDEPMNRIGAQKKIHIGDGEVRLTDTRMMFAFVDGWLDGKIRGEEG